MEMSVSDRIDAVKTSEVFSPEGALAGLTKLVGKDDVDLVGPRAIAEFFEPIFKSFEFIHQTSQVVGLTIAGEKAHATTMIVEYVRPKGGKLMLLLGSYDDSLVRSPVGWRFLRRSLTTKAFTSLAEIAPA
jgi:hypothetical protein